MGFRMMFIVQLAGFFSVVWCVASTAEECVGDECQSDGTSLLQVQLKVEEIEISRPLNKHIDVNKHVTPPTEDLTAIWAFLAACLRMEPLMATFMAVLSCILWEAWDCRCLSTGASRVPLWPRCVCHGCLLACVLYIFCIMEIWLPGWYTKPFTLAYWQVVTPRTALDATAGACVKDLGAMCLGRSAWSSLSAGALASENTHDVEAVKRGVAQAINGGLVVMVTARDIEDVVDQLKTNVDSLAPFFGRLAVVLFENDSADNTRRALKKWASSANGYTVELLNCAADGTFNCRLGDKSRYSVEGEKLSVVGKMASYRNRIVHHVMTDPKYKNFSHGLVVDADLAVSWSPFGILHSMGSKPDSVVAVSGLATNFCCMGSFSAPYDLTAFRPPATGHGYMVSQFAAANDWFCSPKEGQPRWTSTCYDSSPFWLGMIMTLQRSDGDTFYEVKSAFNGATIYPLGAIRNAHAEYDSGIDGERCEHVGFNLALNKSLAFVNRKWVMRIDPARPPGGFGWHEAWLVLTGTNSMLVMVSLFMSHLLLFMTMYHLLPTQTMLSSRSIAEFDRNLGEQIYVSAQGSWPANLLASVISFSADETFLFPLTFCFALIHVIGKLQPEHATWLGTSLSAEMFTDCVMFTMVATFIKLLIGRGRPPYAQQSSFCIMNGDLYSWPSGHTMVAAGLLRRLVEFALPKDPWGPYIVLFYAALVGWSRVAKGRHFPSDVAAGALLGILLADVPISGHLLAFSWIKLTIAFLGCLEIAMALTLPEFRTPGFRLGILILAADFMILPFVAQPPLGDATGPVSALVAAILLSVAAASSRVAK